MRKALALILGIILMFGSIPSISAFADSDPGFSNLVMNHSFSWYSDFPYIDTNGFIYNSYLQSATLVSNGITSHPSPTTVPTLYQDGDYFEVSFDSDILSGYQTPLWNVLIAYDSSTYSSHYDIPNDSIICYLNNELAFYEFQTNLTMDNRKWRCISFICQGNYLESTSIKIEYVGDGTPIQIPITMICFRGYRFTPSGSLTVQEMIELQSNIVNALNTARLADIIGNLDTSDVDLTTLENTTASILQKLASVPDILQYIDQIETQNTHIISAITTFYNYYFNQYQFPTFTNNFTHDIYDKDYNLITVNQTRLQPYYYICIPINDSFNNSFIILNIQTVALIDVEYGYSYVIPSNVSEFTEIPWTYTIAEHQRKNYNFINTIYIPNTYLRINSRPYVYNYLILKIYTSGLDQVYISNQYEYYSIAFVPYKDSWFNRFEYYLKMIINPSGSSVTSDIQQTTDTVADQIDDITSFEDTYNQSLDTSASQIDVSSYQITQTSGMSWMRTYTEYNFDQMQNFRILFLTPLVLALAAFFLRRKQ